MSLPHATRPKESALPRSTRQLLDELDALMDQMLALPVEEEPVNEPPPPALAATLTMIEPDAEATPLPVSPVSRPTRKRRNASNDSSSPKNGFATAVHRQEIPITSVEPATPTPERIEEAPSNAPPWTEGVFEPAPEETASKPEETFALVDLNDDAATNALLAIEPPVPQPAPRAPHREPPRPMPPSSASWVFRTLVVWDRAFRRMTRRLGPLGWPLRTAGGRVFLGMLGLTFWVVSLAWLVRDWLQWTR